MFVSNEPGYYEDGEFGIRIENILLVVEEQTKFRFDNIPFYGFEAFTLVPIQQKMIKVELLEKHEIDWIDQYHSLVWNILNPRIEDPTVKEWLWNETRPISSTKRDNCLEEHPLSASRRSFLTFISGILLSTFFAEPQRAAEMRQDAVSFTKRQEVKPKIDPKISEPSITSKCLLDLEIENRGKKTVVIGLYGGVAPKTSKLFSELCNCNQPFSYFRSSYFL